MKIWLPKTVDGKYKIEKMECPHVATAVDLKRPRAGVMHTTEGYWGPSMSVFRTHYAPTFLVGPGRVAQLVPIGIWDAALENHYGGAETNAWALAQIEVVGFSKPQLYLFDPKTTDTLASVLATLKVVAGIPLTRPFPDQLPPQPWATESFKRRHMGYWGKKAGWFGHIEIPENAHWDPGELNWTKLLAMAKNRVPGKAKQTVAKARHPALAFWHPLGG